MNPTEQPGTVELFGSNGSACSEQLPVEAEGIWRGIWLEEAHHSTAIEGNTLVLEPARSLRADSPVPRRERADWPTGPEPPPGPPRVSTGSRLQARAKPLPCRAATRRPGRFRTARRDARPGRTGQPLQVRRTCRRGTKPTSPPSGARDQRDLGRRSPRCCRTRAPESLPSRRRNVEKLPRMGRRVPAGAARRRPRPAPGVAGLCVRLPDTPITVGGLVLMIGNQPFLEPNLITVRARDDSRAAEVGRDVCTL